MYRLTFVVIIYYYTYDASYKNLYVDVGGIGIGFGFGIQLFVFAIELIEDEKNLRWW
jgi:hypothetical protein